MWRYSPSPSSVPRSPCSRSPSGRTRRWLSATWACGPLVFVSAVAVMFGVYEQVSVWGALTAIPVFAWEITFALWLLVKGFRSSADGVA